MTMTTKTLSYRLRRALAPVFAVFLAFAGADRGSAAESDATARLNFDLPAGDARQMLRQFAAQAKREIVFPVELVTGITTKAVKGEFTAREAIERMLAGTGLVAALDDKTGAFAVKRVADPNGQRAAPASDRPIENRRGEAPGEIRGQISNAVTGANLEHVSVKVRETGREYLTERDGTFAISNLPPGRYSLVIEYPGLDQTVEQVTVGDGQVVRVTLALNSDMYVLPQFVVAGQREGNAAAIAEQRYAPNVTNIITADAFGDVTKANVGNLLRRIPGVTGITDDEIDTSVIQVRGMDASLTSIDIDGTRAASAMNGSRKQNVNSIPVDLIEKVEVAKAPGADDDADSLGGRVKLTTKSAFDLKDRLIIFRAGASYNKTYGKKVTPDGKEYIPASLGATYSDVVGLFGRERSLGIFFTANYDKFLDARSLTSFGHVTPTGGSPGATALKDYSTFDFTSDELHRQERMGASVRLEYKLADHTTVGVSAMFSRYVDDFDRARMGTNGATIDLPLSDPDPNFTVVNNSAYMAQRNLRESQTDTYNIRAFGTTKLAGFKFTYDLNNQQAQKFEFRNQTQFISNRRFNYSLDWRTSSDYPQPVLRSGLDPFTDRFTDTASTGLEVRRQSVDKDIWGARLDAEKGFAWQWPINLKAGLRFRDETQKDDQDRFTAAVATAAGRNLSAYLDDNWKNGGGVDTYPVGAVPSNQKVLGNVKFIGGADPRTAWSYDPALITVNASTTAQQSLLNDRKLNEEVYAGYLQGSVKLGALTAQGGARFERTDLTGNYGVRNRAVTDVFAQFNGRRRVTARYDDIFPSLHLRYGVSDALLVRASVSTTIGRPPLDTVTASEDLNVASRAITIANPDLKPQRSTNYDVSVEYYFRPVGVVSVGAFQKNIRDYIGTVSSAISEAAAAELGAPLTNPSATALTWTVTTDQNNGDARVRGLEFNYSQQLGFLPGAWRGFGVFANYTWLQTDGTSQTTAGVTTLVPLINFIPRSGNAGLSYTYGRWDARLQVNYHSDFCDGFNATNPRLRNSFRGARSQWDFNARCKLTRKLSAFVNLSNFTSQNEPDYSGWVAPGRIDQTIGYSFIITGGVSASF
jgi:iron complex outermembrane receptor protein